MLHTRVTTSYLYSPVLCLEHWLLPRVRKDFGVQGEETVMSQWLSGDLRGQLHIILEARKSGDWYGKLDVINILELYKALVEQAKGQRHCHYRLRPQSCCKTHGVPGSKRSRQTRLGLANPGLVDHSRCAIVMATPAAVITTIVILCVRFDAKTKAASRGRIASICCRLPHVHFIF